jgi:hypothetical protein
MNRRVRLATLVVLAFLLVAAPTLVIIARADRGRASFGDTELVGRNRIASATLDVEAGVGNLPIDVRNLAPGDVAAGAVEVANAGSVPLVYALAASTDRSATAPWLTWSFFVAPRSQPCPTADAWSNAAPVERIDIAGSELAGTGPSVVFGSATTGRDRADRVLDVGASESVCVSVALAIDAPNGVQATTTQLRFTVLAEQVAPEATAVGP